MHPPLLQQVRHLLLPSLQFFMGHFWSLRCPHAAAAPAAPFARSWCGGWFAAAAVATATSWLLRSAGSMLRHHLGHHRLGSMGQRARYHAAERRSKLGRR